MIIRFGALAGALLAFLIASPAAFAVLSSSGPFAVVDADGNLVRQNKFVVSARRIGLGQYVVETNRDIQKCAYLATVGGGTDAVSAAFGLIQTALRVTTATSVFIFTADRTGTAKNLPFHLDIVCK